jgi:hypothetical protein
LSLIIHTLLLLAHVIVVLCLYASFFITLLSIILLWEIQAIWSLVV